MVENRHIVCRSNDDFLSARVFGKGEKIILAFHGYGQDNSEFQILTENDSEVTVYSFDLFCHGQSSFPSDQSPLTHQTLKLLLDDFISQTGIDKFYLAGFSMGGKYALSIASSFPERIVKLILVAPDGIKKDFWYQVATQFSLTRWVFRKVVDYPAFFNRMALLLDRLRIVDGRVMKFAMNEMNTRDKRMKVYQSWVFHRKLFVDLHKLSLKIRDYKISVVFIIGKYDRIITPDYIEPLERLLVDFRKEILPCGHTSLLQKFNENFGGLTKD